jgi:hypothetical protein
MSFGPSACNRLRRTVHRRTDVHSAIVRRGAELGVRVGCRSRYGLLCGKISGLDFLYYLCRPLPTTSTTLVALRLQHYPSLLSHDHDVEIARAERRLAEIGCGRSVIPQADTVKPVNGLLQTFC